MQQGFTEAKPTIPCTDKWNPGTCTKAIMLAYKQVEGQGQISEMKVFFNKRTEEVMISYLSACPHEWALEMLKKAKKEIQNASQ